MPPSPGPTWPRAPCGLDTAGECVVGRKGAINTTNTAETKGWYERGRGTKVKTPLTRLGKLAR